MELHLPLFLSLLMELASHSRATQTPGDAVVTRRCVSFILRSTLGSLLGEKAQSSAAKQLCVAVATQRRAIGETERRQVLASVLTVLTVCLSLASVLTVLCV